MSSAVPFLTPAELGRALGLSASTVKRWSDQGLLRVDRTAGNHRRIDVRDAIRFVREARLRVIQPHRLGLPALDSRAESPERTFAEALFEALVSARGDDARALLESLFLAGRSVAYLSDEVIRPALARIGELWTHGPEGIATEHLATESLLRCASEIRALLLPTDAAPLALGCALSGDPYWLPSSLVSLTLSESGFRTLNLGPETPAEAIAAAAERHRPVLVWISLSRLSAEARLDALCRRLCELGAAVVVGGRAAPTFLKAAHVAANCSELEVFARGFLAAQDARAADAASHRRSEPA